MTFQTANVHCPLIFLSTNTPETFSTGLLLTQSSPTLYSCLGFPKCFYTSTGKWCPLSCSIFIHKYWNCIIEFAWHSLPLVKPCWLSPITSPVFYSFMKDPFHDIGDAEVRLACRFLVFLFFCFIEGYISSFTARRNFTGLPCLLKYDE